MNIDLNRGVTKRIHVSGVAVYMYKDDPGKYLNAFGSEVEDELAKAAGFDVDTLGAARRKKERVAQAMSVIESEFAQDEGTEVVVAESQGFTVVSVGLGRHNLFDPESNKLNSNPLTEEEALRLLEQMVPKSPEQEATNEEAKEEAKIAKATKDVKEGKKEKAVVILGEGGVQEKK